MPLNSFKHLGTTSCSLQQIIIETRGAKTPQAVQFQIGGGLSTKALTVWRSNAQEQFTKQAGITAVNGTFTIVLDPESIYSLSTTTGQQKGSFDNIPLAKPFPFPYSESFDEYSSAEQWGFFPRYAADIAGVFEISERPDRNGKCLRQVVPVRPNSWAPEWLPYTILGDDRWQDYEVSADVYLNKGDSAGVMGRINDVGSGYGSTPKGYYLQLGDDGQCRLVVVGGREDKKTPVSDAEQQALMRTQQEDTAGGEKVLGSARIPNVGPNQWHNVKIRFEGSTITGWIDNQKVFSASDRLYKNGMAGLLASGQEQKLSTPLSRAI